MTNITGFTRSTFNGVLLILAMVLFPVLGDRANAQTAKQNAVKSINTYCKSVDSILKRAKSANPIFADTKDYNSEEKPKWKKFTSEGALETFRNRNETYTISYNWRKNGRIVQSNFTYFSPSGDWAQYVFHCFRPDGSIAKVESDYRTFNEDVIVLQSIFFDTKGRIINKTVQFKDLQSKKTKKVSAEYLKNNKELLEFDYYKKTSRLPFAALLK